jgi:hypothetical protein
MPLPKPGKQEKRSEFVSRCIGDKQTFKDFPDQKQRIAICYTQWDQAKASADVVVGSGDNEVLFSAQKTYGDKKRSELNDSDFLYPQERSFPIVTPADVKDAVNSFGRSKGKNYSDFKSRLVKKARSKGAAFVSALPQTIKDEYKIKASEIIADEQHDLDSLEMTISSLMATKENIECILDCYETDPKVRENLVEPWITAKVAIVTDHINSISNYAMYSEEPSMDSQDIQDMQDSEEIPEGLMHEQNPADPQQDLTENYNKPEDITPSYAGEDSSELFPTVK